MSSKSKNPYHFFDFYCLRTPIFSYIEYLNFIKKTENSDVHFIEILKNKIFREALFLASPQLINQINKWEKGELNNRKKIEKLQSTILKYFTRNTTRCTPFGLFAGCTIGEFADRTQIKLKEIDKHIRISRFDTTFLTQLLQETLKNKAIKENILFYPNTSLYKIGNHYRYVEYITKNSKRNYSIEGVHFSEYLEKILIKAKNGCTMTELSLVLIDNEITKKDANGYINQLIESQILVSELEITVTGKDYLSRLLERIEEISGTSPIYKQLKELQQQLLDIDTTFENSISSYESIVVKAQKLVSELNKKYLFQTDVFTRFNKNTINQDLQKQLHKALILFNKITPPSSNRRIEDFKKRFLNRFEQSEIPLNIVLDIETGIGYGGKRDNSNDLLGNLIIPFSEKRIEHIIWTDADSIMQQKLIDANKNNRFKIELTPEDFKELPLNWDDLPDTYSSMIEVYKSNNKEQIFIKGAGGSSAVNLLGRFSHGNKELFEYITSIVDKEEIINSDKILAEIVHVPEARTGNILQRSSFRKYEIPYLGKASVENKFQIPIEDILVSVRNNRIVLRSRKLNKEILPRLGNAHNYNAAPLPVYQFLCELQTQNLRSSIGFNWNSILKKHPFLPRVVFENCIFSKARWKINVIDFKELFNDKNVLSGIKKWQEKLMIPNYVELVDGDNRLLIYLTNITSIKMLLHTVKNRKQFVLEEFLFSEDEFITDEQGNSYCNQFIVSFYNDQKLKMAQNGH